MTTLSYTTRSNQPCRRLSCWWTTDLRCLRAVGFSPSSATRTARVECRRRTRPWPRPSRSSRLPNVRRVLHCLSPCSVSRPAPVVHTSLFVVAGNLTVLVVSHRQHFRCRDLAPTLLHSAYYAGKSARIADQGGSRRSGAMPVGVGMRAAETVSRNSTAEAASAPHQTRTWLLPSSITQTCWPTPAGVLAAAAGDRLGGLGWLPQQATRRHCCAKVHSGGAGRLGIPVFGARGSSRRARASAAHLLSAGPHAAGGRVQRRVSVTDTWALAKSVTTHPNRPRFPPAPWVDERGTFVGQLPAAQSRKHGVTAWWQASSACVT